MKNIVILLSLLTSTVSVSLASEKKQINSNRKPASPIRHGEFGCSSTERDGSVQLFNFSVAGYVNDNCDLNKSIAIIPGDNKSDNLMVCCVQK